MSIGPTGEFDAMADKGHFTWEAVIALALLGMVLTSVQIVTMGSITRAERSRALFSEALLLEKIQLCVSRIGFAADVPEPCAQFLHTSQAPSEFLKHYTIQPQDFEAKTGRSRGSETPFLRLEFPE
jgi:hypothetical protein